MQIAERVARSKCVPLMSAKLCRGCKAVGEELPSRRCPQCGRRGTMVAILEPSTLEFLLELALGARSKKMTIHEMASLAKLEMIQRELIESGFNYSETARKVGCHRNTVTRLVGAKWGRQTPEQGEAA